MFYIWGGEEKKKTNFEIWKQCCFCIFMMGEPFIDKHSLADRKESGEKKLLT